MYTKFITFVSELVSLDKKITNEKMIYLLLIKKLKVEDNNVKRKSLTLKAVNDKDEKNIYNGEEYEDKTLVTRICSKYLRLKKYGANQRSFRREKSDKGELSN
ncbi:hypothetical protein NC651_003480 [Populus alba x Populus x berolinensis]|nr:hypothetical protein NC651_003480 [Populus alba x Populus x berolinensis]